MALMKCPECRKEIPFEAMHCSGCGSPLNKVRQAAADEFRKKVISEMAAFGGGPGADSTNRRNQNTSNYEFITSTQESKIGVTSMIAIGVILLGLLLSMCDPSGNSYKERGAYEKALHKMDRGVMPTEKELNDAFKDAQERGRRDAEKRGR